jgi:hypothetical protein
MKRTKKKKYAITLLEIMIVIFLIGLIGSVVGYNVKGSMEEGKAFRSEQGAAQIEDILSLETSDGTSAELIAEDPESFLRRSGLCKDPVKMLKDGWGQPYEITALHGTIRVHSKKLERYKEKKQKAAPTSNSAQ